jgi:preprotein translocase SecF subunit
VLCGSNVKVMDFRGKQIDLVGKIRLWFGLSLAVIFVGLVSLVAFKLNLGIDFNGGGQLQYRIAPAALPTQADAVKLSDALESALVNKGIAKNKVQVAGGDTFAIVTEAKNDAEFRTQERVIRAAIIEVTKIADTAENQAYLTPISRELVGPVIGDELRRNAINGVLMGVLLIAGWIYLRYNFAGGGLRYAVAGIVALVHDVFVLIGLFALIGHFWPAIEIDGTFIAALLTVVGYSINDSVVIFDRIRENLRLRRRDEFNSVVNDSLLETMSRSINTGLTVLIMLAALLLFGGHSVYNFVLAMLIGIASGLYSSIFNASMVLVAWHNWDMKKLGSQRPAAGAPHAELANATGGKSTTSLRKESPASASTAGTSATGSAPTKARARRRF